MYQILSILYAAPLNATRGGGVFLSISEGLHEFPQERQNQGWTLKCVFHFNDRKHFLTDRDAER